MLNKKLVIVESPTKARTISRFLGADFDVSSSMGHVRDLPKTKLGVDVKKNFEPFYIIPLKAKPVVAELKKKARLAKEVVLATDEDREGEAIAWHLTQSLGLSDEQTKRIVFHEITKSAIETALKSPRPLDQNLVDAQQARRILDRLVGYELSPFLWKKVMRGLSAGRVQSVAVRLIAERESEIEKFKPEEFWKIMATLASAVDKNKEAFLARLYKRNGVVLKKLEIKSEQEAKSITADLNNAAWLVERIETKEIKRTPAAPFTTSTLQQDCARKFGFAAKQTMILAQQLYEGIELGELDSVGLITYMRTDSVTLAEQALIDITRFVKDQYGTGYALAQPRRYKTKSKGAQEAHEAIRPTDITLTPDKVKPYLDARQYKLYSVIWKRTVASQMKELEAEQTIIDIKATPLRLSSPAVGEEQKKKDYGFRATGQVITFDGYTKVYEVSAEKDASSTNGEEAAEGKLPKLSEGEKLQLLKLDAQQKFTEPPPRYSDAMLIKALEENGIGRPSTYAPIISTILARKYVERIKGRFHPTEIGVIVNDLLVKHFPEIVDVDFTAKMENELDEIAEGQKQWRPVIGEFYEPFKKHLTHKTQSVEKHVEQTKELCPVCGKSMVIKYGRFGKFMACSDFPNCKTTQALPEDQKKENDLQTKYKNEPCPICQKPMTVCRGRFGYFLGCSDYPKCKGIKKIENSTGFPCPNCQQGEIVERFARGKGKLFYACSRYPDCNFTTSTKPQNEEDLRTAFERWSKGPEKKSNKNKKSEKNP